MNIELYILLGLVLFTGVVLVVLKAKRQKLIEMLENNIERVTFDDGFTGQEISVRLNNRTVVYIDYDKMERTSPILFAKFRDSSTYFLRNYKG